MATSISIDVRDAASPVLNRIAGMDLGKLNAEIGRSVANLVQAHLFKLNSERANELGGKRTNFYSQAAKGTHFAADGSGAKVSINQVGFRQRLEGGEIRPVKAKALTIPAIAEAYGRRAREFSNLHVVYNKRGEPAALAEAPATNVKKTKKGFKAAGSTTGRIFFWLVKRVLQRADRSVLPSDERISETALQAASSYVARISGQRGGTG